MSCWDNDAINIGMGLGSEIDMNIREDFPEKDLVQFLDDYAKLVSREYNEKSKTIGGNILTCKGSVVYII